MRYDAFISYSHAADSQLAPRLQDGLQRMARPWWRRRALHVFRDNTGLTANPGLWTSIATSMDESEWFVFLASPEAAASPWVQREIAHWLEHRDVDHLLPVVTDGEWVWDDAANDFDVALSTAVPPALLGAFREEPRHIDMRWAHTEEQLNVRHPHFRDDVAAVAAPMHGLAKDELVGEDVRQHRRTMRWAWGAAVALVLLTVGSAMATVVAVRNADAADVAKSEAQANADEADANATEADQQKALADANAAEAAAKAREALENAQTADRNATEAEQQQQLAEQNATEASQQRSAAEASALDARVQAAEAARQAHAALDARDAESAARADAELQTQNALRAQAEAVSEKQNAVKQEQIAQIARVDAESARAAAESAAAAEKLAREDAQAAQQTAETQALASRSAESGQDPSLSLLLAVEANNRGSASSLKAGVGNFPASLAGTDSPVGRRALFEAVTNVEGGVGAFPVDRFVPMPPDVTDPPTFLWRPALSPDGRWLAAAEFPDPLRGTRAPFPSRIFVWDLDAGGVSVKTMSGHTDIVTTVAFAGNNTLVTQDAPADICATPPTTRIWDVTQGVATHARHAVPYIAPGGNVIALQWWTRPPKCGDDGVSTLNVEFVDASTRKTTIVQSGHVAIDPFAVPGPTGAEPVPWLERPFSRDGRYALGESEGRAVLWDLATGGRAEMPLITPDGFYSTAPSIDPTGQLVTAMIDDTYLAFFRASDGVLLGSQLVAGPTEFPTSVVWSPDGSIFTVSIVDGYDYSARVLTVTGSNWWGAYVPLGEVGFTTVGNHLTIEVQTGLFTFATVVVDAETGDFKRALDGQLLAAGRADGSLLFAQHFDDDGRPHLFVDDLVSGRTVQADDPSLTVVAVAADAARLVVTTDDGAVRAWDLVTGEGPVEATATGTLMLGVAFDPQSPALVGVGIGSTVTRWDTSRRGAAENLGAAATKAAILDDGVTVAEPDETGHGIIFRNLVTGATRPGATLEPDDDIEYLLSRTAAGPVVANLTNNTSVVTSMDGDVLSRLPEQVADISRDGTRLVVRPWDRRTVDVYATNDLRSPIRSIDLTPLPDDDLTGLPDVVVLDSEGKRVAATNATGSVVVWDVATRRVLTRQDGTPGDLRSYPLFGLSFSPQGDRLVEKSPSNLVRMWATSDWSLQANQQISPIDAASRVVFSPDGGFVAVDGLFLFDGATLEPIAELVRGTGFGTKFSADGRSMLSLLDDGTVLRWGVGVDELVDSACQLAGRNLSQTEWTRYLGSADYRLTCPGYPPGS